MDKKNSQDPHEHKPNSNKKKRSENDLPFSENSKNNDENTQKKAPQSAHDLAQAMAANLTVNQADPNFDIDRMKRHQEIADEIFKKRAERLAAAKNQKPESTEQ